MKINIIHEPNINEPEITVKYGYIDTELEDVIALLPPYLTLFAYCI